MGASGRDKCSAEGLAGGFHENKFQKSWKRAYLRKYLMGEAILEFRTGFYVTTETPLFSLNCSFATETNIRIWKLMPGRESLVVQVDGGNVLEIILKVKRILEKLSLVRCGIFQLSDSLRVWINVLICNCLSKICSLHEFLHSNLIPRVFLSMIFFSNKATINTAGKSCPC